MNKQIIFPDTIFKLLVDSGLMNVMKHTDLNIDKELDKFALSIINECVGVSDAYVRGDVDSPSYSPTARSRIGIKIQEHFGIQK